MTLDIPSTGECVSETVGIGTSQAKSPLREEIESVWARRVEREN